MVIHLSFGYLVPKARVILSAIRYILPVQLVKDLGIDGVRKEKDRLTVKPRMRHDSCFQITNVQNLGSLL